MNIEKVEQALSFILSQRHNVEVKVKLYEKEKSKMEKRSDSRKCYIAMSNTAI